MLSSVLVRCPHWSAIIATGPGGCLAISSPYLSSTFPYALPPPSLPSTPSPPLSHNKINPILVGPSTCLQPPRNPLSLCVSPTSRGATPPYYRRVHVIHHLRPSTYTAKPYRLILSNEYSIFCLLHTKPVVSSFLPHTKSSLTRNSCIYFCHSGVIALFDLRVLIHRAHIKYFGYPSLRNAPQTLVLDTHTHYSLTTDLILNLHHQPSSLPLFH